MSILHRAIHNQIQEIIPYELVYKEDRGTSVGVTFSGGNVDPMPLALAQVLYHKGWMEVYQTMPADENDIMLHAKVFYSQPGCITEAANLLLEVMEKSRKVMKFDGLGSKRHRERLSL